MKGSIFAIAAALLGAASAGSFHERRSGHAQLHENELRSSAPANASASLYAMSYTPYKSDSNGESRCATADEVSSDIASIAKKGFSLVRTYATDCNGLEHIGQACKAANMKMIVGIYVDHEGLNSQEVTNQVTDIKDYFNGDYSLVEMVLLGNEVLFNNFASPADLASKIKSTKSELKAAGFDGPVSTADTLASLQEDEETLCDSLDVLAANIHPFFNDATSAAAAGSFVSQQLQTLKGLCGGSKKSFNSECGWPSLGEANGAAIPGVVEQQIAIESIKQAAGPETCFFSFENDLWKDPGYLGVEAAWGCANLF